MKLTALLLTAAFLNVGATGISQNITYRAKNVPLKTVFAELKKQSGFYFFCDEALLDKTAPVTINAKQEPLFTVLDKVLKPQQLNYTVKGNNIIVSEIFQVEDNPAPTISDALPPPISGIIRDADGNPLQGVNVVIKGTKIGVTTNADGKFSIDAKENDVLVISSIGYNAREVKITSVNVPHIVALDKSVSELDEVQYIAYGTQTRRFSVGNVTTVKGEDIAKQPVNNPMLALQGRVPGLNVTQETGLNGGGVKIRIQGENSIRNGNNPLIIIDGVPYPTQLPHTDFSETLLGNGGLGSPLSFVSMNDIESIDVLKDADATSIYGSRAANGAILITTKKGKPGKQRININLQQGWSEVANKMEMLNTRQYLDMRYEGMKNAGLIPVNRTGLTFPYIYAPDLTIWDTTRFTDWQKELIGGTAQYANYNASLSGGTATSNYMVGLTYNRNTDVFPGAHEMKSGALHFNLNTSSLNQRFKMQLTGTYTLTDNSLPGIDLTADAIRLVPVAPPLIDDDTLNWAPNPLGVDTWNNPLEKTFYRRYRNNTRVLNTNGMVSYAVLKGLDIRCQFGYNAIQAKSSLAVPLAAIRPVSRPSATREASFNNSTVYTMIAEPQLTYHVPLGKAKLDVLAGATIQQDISESASLYATGYTSDLLMDGILGAASVIPSLTKSIYKYNAAFARIGFNWDNRYLLSVNARRDGSSRFGPERRFHDFTSLGLGYIFTEEAFFKHNFPLFTFGKLRVTYGTTGSDQIADYVYLSNNTSFLPDILYQGTSPMRVKNLHNPYIQWEETRKWQGGVDLGFWKDRILFSITYARNRSSNQLIEYVLPAVTGFETITENFPATLQNTSWEFMLNTVNLKSVKLKWTTSFNLTIPRNKVVAFPNIEESSYAEHSSGIIVGQPKGVTAFGAFKGLDPATGSYVGIDGAQNPVAVGLGLSRFISLAPIYYGGFRNSFSFKGWHIDVLFQYVRQWGNTQFEYWNGEWGPGIADRGRGNQPVTVLDRWQKPGDVAPQAPFSAATNFIYRSTLGGALTSSDAFYSRDASYVRLKNVAFSWDLPIIVLRKLKLQSGRLYTQGQNLFTFTNYAGLDPETGSVTTLPPLRTWTVGVQVVL